jgi:multidrug efflux pump subunit AcrA (membrane-fusion protein)
MTTPTSNPHPGAGSPQSDPDAAVREKSGHAPAGDHANGSATELASRDSVHASGATNGSVATVVAGGPHAHASAPPSEHPTAATAVMAAAPTARPPAPASPPVVAPAPAPGPATAPDEHGPTRAHGPGHAGRHRPDHDLIPRHRTGNKRKRLLLLIPILLTALVVTLLLGYRYWYESTYFVSTDNASVTGDLVQVGSLNAGRIVATRVDVGRQVREGQEIAVVAMPREVGNTATGAAPRMGITGTDDSLVPVYSPLNGIVAARVGHVGGTVTAGQPIFFLVDPAQVWVRANIEESSAWRVQLGQAAEIHVDALNRGFTGRVDAITPASAATFSLLPANNASGNFTKVTQYVPIKIVVDARGVVLPLGTSVEVRIQVREPQSELPLPWQP